MKDTIEKDVQGLAEKLIAEDEERRMQELVCFAHCFLMLHIAKVQKGCVQYCSQTC